MAWHVVVTLLPYMPLAYRLPLLELESVLSGVLPSDDVWQQCVSDTESAFGFVTGALFVDENFSKADKLDVSCFIIKLCCILIYLNAVIINVTSQCLVLESKGML